MSSNSSTSFAQKISQITSGASAPLGAFKLLLKKKDLFFLSLLPLLATFGIYFYFFSHLAASTQEYLQLKMSNALAPGTSDWLGPLFKMATSLLFTLIGILTFSFTASIVSLPFNDFLAERTEKYLRISSLPESEKGWPALLRHLWIDLLKTVFSGVISFFLFLFSWIPIVHLVTIPLLMLFAAFPFISFAQTRRGYGLLKSFKLLFKHWPLHLGFGATLMLCFSIPLFSGFFLPLAVIAGTLVFAKSENSQANPS